MTVSYKELYEQSEKLIKYLHTKNIFAERKEESFRDYHVKLLVDNLTLILYHKPSKKTFSIGTQEIKNIEQKQSIEKLWYDYLHQDETPIQGLCAYVDGSFYQKQIGWGVVLVENNQVLEKLGGKISCPKLEESHQIAGEIEGVIQALSYAQNNSYSTITIYYDYMGLQKWACKEWKANSYVAQQYVNKLKDFSIKITWKKVKAHTGNLYNEMADNLAKHKS